MSDYREATAAADAEHSTVERAATAEASMAKAAMSDTSSEDKKGRNTAHSASSGRATPPSRRLAKRKASSSSIGGGVKSNLYRRMRTFRRHDSTVILMHDVMRGVLPFDVNTFAYIARVVQNQVVFAKDREDVFAKPDNSFSSKKTQHSEIASNLGFLAVASFGSGERGRAYGDMHTGLRFLRAMRTVFTDKSKRYYMSEEKYIQAVLDLEKTCKEREVMRCNECDKRANDAMTFDGEVDRREGSSDDEDEDEDNSSEMGDFIASDNEETDDDNDDDGDGGDDDGDDGGGADDDEYSEGGGGGGDDDEYSEGGADDGDEEESEKCVGALAKGFKSNGYELQRKLAKKRKLTKTAVAVAVAAAVAPPPATMMQMALVETPPGPAEFAVRLRTARVNLDAICAVYEGLFEEQVRAPSTFLRNLIEARFYAFSAKASKPDLYTGEVDDFVDDDLKHYLVKNERAQ